MKSISLGLLLLISSSAFASTVTCTFGEKVLQLEVADLQVLSAYWSNPDWGVAGAHQIAPEHVKYFGQEAVVTGDELPDANGPYACQ